MNFILIYTLFLLVSYNEASPKKYIKPKNKSSNNEAINPGFDSYFPLLSGSFWVYEETVFHKWRSEGRKTIYIDSLYSNDSCIIARAKQIIPSKKDSLKFYFCIYKSGIVFETLFLDSIDYFTKIAYLHPVQGDSLSKWGETPPLLRFQHHCDSDTECVRFETVDLIEREGWYGVFFKKGIGKVYSGFSESGDHLVEYRIGHKGKVKQYYKLNKETGEIFEPDSN